MAGVAGVVTDAITAECEQKCQNRAVGWMEVLLYLEWPEKASLEF